MSTTILSDPTKYITELENKTNMLNWFASASTASLTSLQIKQLDDKNTYDEILFIRNVQQVLINEIASMQVDISDLQSISNSTSTASSPSKVNDHTLYRFRENINRLMKILKLENDWDGYGAKPFDANLIAYCIDIISCQDLKYQPYIYPTLDGPVHFQFDLSANKHLEIQVSFPTSTYYQRIDATTNKGKIETQSDIIRLINEFFSN